MSRSLYYAAVYANDKEALEPYIKNIAKDAADRIRRRELCLGRIIIRERIDKTTGKIRQIGRETPMQQVFDHIAVGAASEIWNRRIVPQQASSIKGRGQLYGTKIIRSWIQKDNRCIKWARAHHVRYTSKCRFFVKLDIKKCYPNARMEVFMRLFEKDCGNADLIWLWRELLSSHRVDGYEGFLIGALPSQWACQYLISFIYREAMSLAKIRRGKRVRLVTHALVYLDDILLTGSSRRDLMIAIDRIVQFAREKFGFTIKPKWSIYELEKQSIDMMGFVVHRNGSVSIRGRDFVHARRMILRGSRQKSYSARQAQRTCSYKGYFKNSDSRKFRQENNADALFDKAARVVSITERRKNHDRQLRFQAGNCAVHEAAQRAG